MTQQTIDLEIISPVPAPSAANVGPTESIGFSRERRSLDHSVWYNGSLMTFLATGADTHGQFALIEALARRGNVPPPHIHHREDEMRSSTYWRARSSFQSGIAQSRECLAP